MLTIKTIAKKVFIAQTATVEDMDNNDFLVIRATLNGVESASNPAFLRNSVESIAEEMGVTHAQARAELAAFADYKIEHEYVRVDTKRIADAMGVYGDATNH